MSTPIVFETAAEWAEKHGYSIRQAQRIAAGLEGKGLAQFKRTTSKMKAQWIIWAGYRASPVTGPAARPLEAIVESLGEVAAGRGKILTRWREALKRGKTSGKHADTVTRHFLKTLAATGTIVARTTLYNWWRSYLAAGLDGLVDGRSQRHAVEAQRASVQPGTGASPADPDRRQSLTLNLPGDVAVTLHVSAGMAIEVKEGESGIVIAIGNRRGGGASKGD